ncbi:MAG: nucleotidyltransferase family protein [Chloroflexi bacterium]|nr:nucleotidyltransferase family protein [Chloroflexota bacterium]
MTKKTLTGLPDMTQQLGADDQLLLHCARIQLSPERREAIKALLAGSVDWEVMLRRASWQRLSCLVSVHLRSQALSALVPLPVRQQLQRMSYASVARNMLMQDELAGILSALQREKIPVIVLKGSALLGSVYPDISLRPMADLDILVHEEDLEHAEAIALGRGFAQVVDHRTHEEAKEKWHQLPYLIHAKKRIALEIHQHIVDSDDPFRFDLNDFWARARPNQFLSAGALCLAPEDLLIHLSIKFLLDRRYGSDSALGQLCDISEVMFHHGVFLDWNLLKRAADDYGLVEGLHCVFHTCDRLLGTSPPASFLNSLRPSYFDETVAGTFIMRRVLDTTPWLAHDLVPSKSPYTRLRAFWSFATRFFCIPEELAHKRGQPGFLVSFYAKRVEDVFPRMWRALLKPSDLRNDLLLDRWLHDLYRARSRT